MDKGAKARGAAKVRAILADEQRAMQARAYKRLRPYLASAMSRLRRVHPAFQTVVFCAKDAGFAFVFGDGTQPREAPKAFGGLKEACEDLAQLSEIEWLTAADPLWQVLTGTPQPALVVEQCRYVQDKDWTFWMRRSLRDARYYMRQAIYSRTVHGSHRPGYGTRIVADNGVLIDEWVDPIEQMIARVLRESGKPASLDRMRDEMKKISGFRDGYYIWDVLHACKQLRQRGVLRRVNPMSDDGHARFGLCPSPPTGVAVVCSQEARAENGAAQAERTLRRAAGRVGR